MNNIDDIVAEAERLSAELAHIATVLDSNIYRVDGAANRGALSRLARVSFDVAAGLKRR